MSAGDPGLILLIGAVVVLVAVVAARPAVRDQTERRLRAVSRAGKLAGWLGERGR